MDEYQLAVRRRIGERVREARKLRDLTQERLAELVGNTHRHVGQVERGEVNVTIDILSAMALHLSVDVSHLVAPPAGEGSAPASFTIPARDLDSLDQAVENARQTIARIRSAQPPREPGTSE